MDIENLRQSSVIIRNGILHVRHKSIYSNRRRLLKNNQRDIPLIITQTKGDIYKQDI